MHRHVSDRTRACIVTRGPRYLEDAHTQPTSAAALHQQLAAVARQAASAGIDASEEDQRALWEERKVGSQRLQGMTAGDTHRTKTEAVEVLTEVKGETRQAHLRLHMPDRLMLLTFRLRVRLRSVSGVRARQMR